MSIERGNIVTVTFGWDDRFGPCYECGLPTAYLIDTTIPDDPTAKRCSVCAALAVASGDTVGLVYLFAEDPDEVHRGPA